MLQMIMTSSCGQNHARHCRGPARIRSEFMLQEFPKPCQWPGRVRYVVREGAPPQRPRITTTADSLTRNKSWGGFSTRTRTG